MPVTARASSMVRPGFEQLAMRKKKYAAKKIAHAAAKQSIQNIAAPMLVNSRIDGVPCPANELLYVAAVRATNVAATIALRPSPLGAFIGHILLTTLE
ncbi:protein of unknown function [Pararobbsia alpina]